MYKYFALTAWMLLTIFGLGLPPQQQVQPVSGVLTLNLVPGTSSFKVILSANVTSVVIQNPTPGTIISVIFTENAAGGFTVTFGGNIANPCSVSTAASTTTTCQFQYDSTNNTWNGIGGGGGNVSGTAPPVGFYLSPSCKDAGITNPLCYTTPADTLMANDCAWTSGAPDVTCQTAHFVSTDIGKNGMGYQTCVTSTNLNNNSNNGPFTASTVPTIATFISSTHITMSANAATTVTFRGSFPQGGCFWWGHPDDAGASALDTAAQASTTCPRIHFPNAYYWFNNPHFFTLPNSCAIQGTNSGANAGNIVYAAGYELDGRGTGTTLWFIPPDFPEGGAAQCQHGLSTKGCWVVPLEGRWTNIQITGGGNYLQTFGVTGVANFLELDGPASLDNFTCTNWGQKNASGNISGIGAYLWAQLTQVNLSSCGVSALQTSISSSVTAIRLWVENTGSYEGIGIGELADYFGQTVSQFSRYNFICYDCTIGQEGNSTASPMFGLVVRGTNQKIKWYRGGISTEFGPTVNGNQGFYCATATCLFDIEDANIDFSTPAGDQNNIGIQCAAACNVLVKNSTIKGSATGGFGYKDVVGSSLIDLGGNTWGTVSLVGSFIGPTNSARSAVCATGNFALTSGWGTSSVTSVAANGDVQGCHVTITGAAGAAGPVLTWTYPVAPPVAPGSCHLVGVSGTLTGVATGTPGATTVAFTFAGTPSAQTYVFDVGCP